MKDYVVEILDAERQSEKLVLDAQNQAKEILLNEQKRVEKQKLKIEKKLVENFQVALQNLQNEIEKTLKNQIEDLKSKPIVVNKKKFAKAKQFVLSEVLKFDC